MSTLLRPIASVADTTGRRLTSSRAAERARAATELALRHPAIAGFLAFTGLIAALRPASFNAPIDQDAGQYLYVGKTILDGGTPYVDAANNKGPMTFLLFAGIRLVSGTSPVVVRLALLVFAGLAALALAGYVGRLAGRAVGITAGFVFAALTSAAVLQGSDPNTEQFGVAPMAGALYFAARGGRRAAAASGLCAAAAVLMNPAFGIVVPVAAFELWRAEPRPDRLRRFAWATAGVVVLAGPILLWLGVAGAVDDMVRQVLGHASGSVGTSLTISGQFTQGPEHVGEFYRLLNVPAGSLWVAALLGCVFALRDPKLRRLSLPAAAWLVLSWGRVKVVNYEFLHHYYPALVGICVGLAVGIAAFWRSGTGARVALATLVLAAPVWSLVIGPQWDALHVPARDRYGVNYPYALAYPVGSYIRGHTASGDRILVAGSQAEVYFLADRLAPTRFFDLFPILDHPAYEQERQRDLLRNPPAAVAFIAGERVDGAIRALFQSHSYRLGYDENGSRVYLLE